MKPKIVLSFTALVLLGLFLLGCGSSFGTKRKAQINPSFIIKPGEPIAIMPFETESALSNLGGQVSDEVIVNLLEYSPRL